ncbi:hypothetical protein [Rhodococcus aetherivorans]|uniref:hypothetical protein n=1 Tax=Rhodococcus aetherivorans TaxID=191292 RepID=UPI001187591E|nr:hypothetical protein [Rhodococcus aetherivorans]WKW98833.1 hypothetical protein Q3O43_00365 [Rhodococcus aetherivorans]
MLICWVGARAHLHTDRRRLLGHLRTRYSYDREQLPPRSTRWPTCVRAWSTWRCGDAGGPEPFRRRGPRALRRRDAGPGV